MQITRIPYQELQTISLLLLLTPFLKVNRYLNPFIFYSFVLGVFKTQQWVLRSDFPVAVLLGAENQALFYMMLLIAFVVVMKSKLPTDWIISFLSFFGVLNTAVTLGLLPWREPFVSGLVSNKGLNAILNVALLPFLLTATKSWSFNWLLAVLSTLTIFLSGSRSAYLSLGTLLFFKIESRMKYLVLPFVVVTCLAFSPHPFQYKDRLGNYQFFFRSFTTSDVIFGRGPGSFFPFSSYEQIHYGHGIIHGKPMQGDGLAVWMHSDPLQVIYEYGVVGVVLITPAIVWSFLYAGVGTASLMALYAGGLFYYPWHQALHLIVIFLLFKIAVNNYNRLNVPRL